MSAKRERFLKEDEIVTLDLDDSTHIVSENHFYKSEGYYALVKNEIQGLNTLPRSADVIDAYVVPICLEKAMLAGMPVCSWEVGYTACEVPCIIYGLNYFSTPDEYFVVEDPERAKEIVKHVTNNGRYPYCYQILQKGANVKQLNAVFGKVAKSVVPEAETLAKQVYDVFRIPLVSIVYVEGEGGVQLSSLGPVRYTKLSKKEKEMLNAILKRKPAESKGAA